MGPGPAELEKRFRRFLEGRGDEIAPLFSFLRSDIGARPEEKAWAALILSRIYLLRGAVNLAAAFLKLSSSLDRAGSDGIRLGILVNGALVRKARGRVSDAASILRVVMNEAIRREEPFAAAKAASNAAVCFLSLGNLVEASSYASFAARIYEALNYREGLVRIELVRSSIDAARGNLGEAIDRLAKLVIECEGAALERERLATILAMAENYIALGDLDGALASIEQASSMEVAQKRFLPLKIRFLLVRSAAFRALGNYSCALDFAMQAERLRSRFNLVSERRPFSSPQACGGSFAREVSLESDGVQNFVRGNEATVKMIGREILRLAVGENEFFVAASDSMKRLISRLKRASPLSVPILLRGETGTGKDLLARLVHLWSGREREPFVAVNAASIPSELFESALFGHSKGAFTGAVCSRGGLVTEAKKGTLFLDEIGELSPALQVKLLRFVERGEYFSVGDSGIKKSSARVIFATNRNLAEACRSGAFRLDLYHRISILSFTVPPLREHRDDIVVLAEHFLEEFRMKHGIEAERFEPAAIEALERFDWPGNVRELEATVLEAALRCRRGAIKLSDLPHSLIFASSRSCESRGLRDLELACRRERIMEALRDCGGNRTQAAVALGIARTTLVGMMKRLGIS